MVFPIPSPLIPHRVSLACNSLSPLIKKYFYNVNAAFPSCLPHFQSLEQTLQMWLPGADFLTQIQDVHVTEVERSPLTAKNQQLVLQQSS